MNQIIESIKKMTSKNEIKVMVKLFNEIGNIIHDEELIDELVELKEELDVEKQLFLEMILESVSASYPTATGKTSLYLINSYIDDPNFDMSTPVPKVDVLKLLKKNKIPTKSIKSIKLSPHFFSQTLYYANHSQVAHFLYDLDGDELVSDDENLTRPFYLIPLIIEENDSSEFDLSETFLKMDGSKLDGFYFDLSEALSTKAVPVSAFSLLSFYDSLLINHTSEMSVALKQLFDIEKKQFLVIDTITVLEDEDVILMNFYQKDELVLTHEDIYPSKGSRLNMMGYIKEILLEFGFKLLVESDTSATYKNIRGLH